MPKEFIRLKEKVLGKSYDLSLVFTTQKVSRRLNRIYRKRDYPPDVLSFPISKTSGEIFIDRVTARKEAQKFGMYEPKFIKFLFIHGLLHLKGMRHGAKMEEVEKKLLHGSSNHRRH